MFVLLCNGWFHWCPTRVTWPWASSLWFPVKEEETGNLLLACTIYRYFDYMWVCSLMSMIKRLQYCLAIFLKFTLWHPIQLHITVFLMATTYFNYNHSHISGCLFYPLYPAVSAFCTAGIWLTQHVVGWPRTERWLHPALQAFPDHLI